MPLSTAGSETVLYQNSCKKNMHPQKFNMEPEKDGWKTILSNWGPVTVQGVSC